MFNGNIYVSAFLLVNLFKFILLILWYFCNIFCCLKVFVCFCLFNNMYNINSQCYLKFINLFYFINTNELFVEFFINGREFF